MFLGSRRERVSEVPAAVPLAADHASVFPTKALKKFLTTLTSRDSPVLLDLGPVVGTNVTFFGERLGCKIFVEDLFGDLNRHAREGKLAAFAEFLAHRLTQEESSIDGVLCWNLLDYLEPKAAQVLAGELTRVLRPEGALLGFFGTASTPDGRFTKYVIVDDESLRHQPYGGVEGQHRVLLNRDIIRLFNGLRVAESFLLKTNVREILFRKPSYLGHTAGT